VGFRGLWICGRVKILSQQVKLDGLGIALHIQRASNELLQALRRTEQNTRISSSISSSIIFWISFWISTVWARTETNPKVKDDRLTVAGGRQPGETEE